MTNAAKNVKIVRDLTGDVECATLSINGETSLSCNAEQEDGESYRLLLYFAEMMSVVEGAFVEDIVIPEDESDWPR